MSVMKGLKQLGEWTLCATVVVACQYAVIGWLGYEAIRAVVRPRKKSSSSTTIEPSHRRSKSKARKRGRPRTRARLASSGLVRS